MFPTKTLDPEIKRQRIALAKCYSLLLRLADEVSEAKNIDTTNPPKAERRVSEGGKNNEPV